MDTRTTLDQSEVEQKAGAGYAYFLSFAAALGGFLFGYDLAIISGAQLYLREYLQLTPAQFGLAVSSALIGCVFAPSVGAFVCDRLGRKSALLVAAATFTAGAIWTALADSIITFDVFRIVGGFGVGLASLASPMYIAEVAPAERRGRLGLMYQLAITIGALSATVVSWILAETLPETTSWRWMFASIIPPILAFVIVLLRVPQSPRWLAGKNRDAEALAVLTRVNGAQRARRELDEIKESLNEETGSFSELFQPGIRLALLAGILLAFFNMWTGWSAVASYLPALFQMGGYSAASDAIGVSIIPMVANVILTLVAIRLVDRTGRKPIWIGTSVAMCLCLTLMGLIFFLELRGAIVIVMTLLIIAPHAIGLGPLPWLMMSEIFPTRVRARAVSISTTVVWISAFTSIFAFPKLVDVSEKAIGSPAGLFWIYACICVFSLVFGWTLLPETKGRSLEEIARSWRKH